MIKIVESVPFISQLVAYPTGCESVSAVMALQYAGIDVTVDEFIDRFLPKGPAPSANQPVLSDGKPVLFGPDPWECFPGDPYTREGWGCFAPALRKAIEACLASRKAQSGSDSATIADHLTIHEYYHEPLEQLVRETIAKDVPLIFWATIGMAEPHESLRWRTETGREIRWMSPMHCTLLIGYEEGPDETITHYIFNDPTSGEGARFDSASVARAYRAQGEQAIVVTKEQ